MDLRKISHEFWVSPQISPDDMAEIAARNVRAIICNRPDGESADQPPFAEIAAAAKAKGMEARYIPVQSGGVRDEDVDAFAAALEVLPHPVLAYCRSGTRSATLWSLHVAEERPVADILAAAEAQGYDLSGLASRIAARGAGGRDRVT